MKLIKKYFILAYMWIMTISFGGLVVLLIMDGKYDKLWVVGLLGVPCLMAIRILKELQKISRGN